MSAVRGLRPNVLSYLLKGSPEQQAAAKQAPADDQILAENEQGDSALMLAERQNMSLFSHCQTLGPKTTTSDLDSLERSNRVVKMLLAALSSAKVAEFKHLHECFKDGLSFADWSMRGSAGAGGNENVTVVGVMAADYD